MHEETATCPWCEAYGVIDGICSDVVPKSVKCGHCQRLFPYERNAWDHIRNAYDGELGHYYLRVTRKPDAQALRRMTANEVAQAREQRRQAFLKAYPTKRILTAYREQRRDNTWFTVTLARRNGHGPYGYSGEEIRAELDTREHIPTGDDAKVARRRASQGKTQ